MSSLGNKLLRTLMTDATGAGCTASPPSLPMPHQRDSLTCVVSRLIDRWNMGAIDSQSQCREGATLVARNRRAWPAAVTVS